MAVKNDPYLYAVHLLGRRAYSCRELSDKLTRRGFSTAAVGAALDKLAGRG